MTEHEHTTTRRKLLNAAPAAMLLARRFMFCSIIVMTSDFIVRTVPAITADCGITL